MVSCRIDLNPCSFLFAPYANQQSEKWSIITFFPIKCTFTFAGPARNWRVPTRCKPIPPLTIINNLFTECFYGIFSELHIEKCSCCLLPINLSFREAVESKWFMHFLKRFVVATMSFKLETHPGMRTVFRSYLPPRRAPMQIMQL